MRLVCIFLAVAAVLAGCSSSKTRKLECGCEGDDDRSYLFTAEPRSSGGYGNLSRVSTDLYSILRDLQDRGDIYGLCYTSSADGRRGDDTFIFCGDRRVEDEIFLALGDENVDLREQRD